MKNDKISNIKTQIADLQAALIAEEKRLSLMTPEQQLADRLHGMFCNANHVDGCGYQYENWIDVSKKSLSQTTKGGWVKKAQEIQKLMTKHDIEADAVFEIISVARGY